MIMMVHFLNSLMPGDNCDTRLKSVVCLFVIQLCDDINQTLFTPYYCIYTSTVGLSMFRIVILL